jgi:hypothetical protein
MRTKRQIGFLSFHDEHGTPVAVQKIVLVLDVLLSTLARIYPINLESERSTSAPPLSFRT